LKRLDALTRVPDDAPDAPHVFRTVHLSGGRYLIGNQDRFLFCKGDVLFNPEGGMVVFARPVAEAIRFDEAGLLVLFGGRTIVWPFSPFLFAAFELDGAEVEEALDLDPAVLRGQKRDMVSSGRLGGLAQAAGVESSR